MRESVRYQLILQLLLVSVGVCGGAIIRDRSMITHLSCIRRRTYAMGITAEHRHSSFFKLISSGMRHPSSHRNRLAFLYSSLPANNIRATTALCNSNDGSGRIYTNFMMASSTKTNHAYSKAYNNDNGTKQKKKQNNAANQSNQNTKRNISTRTATRNNKNNNNNDTHRRNYTQQSISRHYSPQANIHSQSTFTKTSSSSTKLLNPTTLYTNNHILVISKPPGYHSQPNDDNPNHENNPKCLLTKLKSNKMGGGSNNDFLLPMHRLDQPCTGVLLLAKNSKAGTRIGNAFRKHRVIKDYFCVVEGDLGRMIDYSSIINIIDDKQRRNGKNRYKGEIYKAIGRMIPTRQSNGKAKGKSVKFIPLSPTVTFPSSTSSNPTDKEGRICEITWQHILTIHSQPTDQQHPPTRQLIQVQTSTGAKHQVRAMLSQILHSPICGDLRYGSKHYNHNSGSNSSDNNNKRHNNMRPLPDQSVALHARTLKLPTVQLANTPNEFVAPIPQSWKDYFGITERDLGMFSISSDS